MIPSQTTHEPCSGKTSYEALHKSFCRQLTYHGVPSDFADNIAWQMVYEVSGRRRTPEHQAQIDAAWAIVRNSDPCQAATEQRGSGRVSV